MHASPKVLPPLLLPLLAALLLSACAGGNRAPPSRTASLPASAAPAAQAPQAARQGPWPMKIGKPYQVAGVWYYPADDRDYAEEGVASWYGPGFHAGQTANGETYDQNDITAAHRTLPMPSWVEVENLDNGRKLTVRINDRGPFAKGRIIDLSWRSAQLLGLTRAGTGRVKLRRVYPEGVPAQPAPPPAAPPPVVVAAAPPVIAAVPAVTTVAVPAGSPAAAPLAAGWLVQVAALSDAGRVAWLKAYLAGVGPVVTEPAGSLTRVRLGPYAQREKADAALAQVRAAGYTEARLIPPSNSATAR